MRYRVIAVFSVVLSVLAPCGLAAAQDSPKNDVKGLFLLTDYPAVSVRPGHHLDRQPAPAELRSAARAARALGRRRARRLDRDPGRRRPADRGRHAGDQCQRLARAAARRAEGRPDRHHEPHGHRQGQHHQSRAADRRHARQGPAGQAHGDAAASGAARQFQIELRVSALHQERQRQEADRRARRRGAAELRRDLHRAVRQPGAERGSDRCRPVQGRQAEGASAEHGRRRQIQGHGPGRGGGRQRDHRSRPGGHRPAEDRLSGREGVLSRQGHRRQDTVGSDRAHQYRRRAPPKTSRSPARRRAAGRSPSIRRPSTRSRRTTPRRCRRRSRRREKAIAGDYVSDAAGQLARRLGLGRPSASASPPRRMWGIVGVGIIGVALLVMVGAVARFGRR